jgi:hypothetical protein
MQVKIKQNLKQSKGCACEKLPLQKSSFSSPATAPEKGLDGWRVVVDDDYNQLVGNPKRKV